MPRRKRVHPDALLLTYQEAAWILGCELHGFGWYNEGPGEMDMNIKFEWSRVGSGRAFQSHTCLLGNVGLGTVTTYGSPAYRIESRFGMTQGDQRQIVRDDIPTLDEAKAWVEEQARAWLAEVTA